jgi:hypothetical protein
VPEDKNSEDRLEGEVEEALEAGMQAEAEERSLQLRKSTSTKVMELLRESVALYTGVGGTARQAALDLAQALRHASGAIEQRARQWPDN